MRLSSAFEQRSYDSIIKYQLELIGQRVDCIAKDKLNNIATIHCSSNVLVHNNEKCIINEIEFSN